MRSAPATPSSEKSAHTPALSPSSRIRIDLPASPKEEPIQNSIPSRTPFGNQELSRDSMERMAALLTAEKSSRVTRYTPLPYAQRAGYRSGRESARSPEHLRAPDQHAPYGGRTRAPLLARSA